jgi:ABC-type branched-subunit amino acid transport system substrate-binding protein
MIKPMKFLRSLVFLLCFLFPGYSYGSPELDIEIGASLPLSGPLSALGTAVANGIELAKYQHPDKFKGIKILLDDNGFDAKTALASFNKLSTRPQMELVFIWGSPTCMAVAPIAERTHRPLICFSGDPKPQLDYVISFNNPASDFALVMAQHLASLKSSARIALIYSDIPFFGSLADALEQQLQKSRSVLHRESVLPEMQDFSSLIARLKTQQFEAVALFLLPPQIPTVARQMGTLKYRPAIIGADTFSDSEAIEQAKGELDHSVYVDMAIDPDFTTAYSKKYHNKSNLAFAYNGYQFASLVGDILQGEARPLKPEALIGKLRNYKAPKATTNPIRFQRTESFGQYFSFPIEIKKVDATGHENSKLGRKG